MFLILIHEVGHFIAAKLTGVRVVEFAIGMGFAVWKKQIGETTYSLRVFPLGGFCEMEGEDSDVHTEGSFNSKTKLQRFFVLFAGAFMNILTGLIILIVLALNSPYISTTVVDDFKTVSAQSQAAGLSVGDRIIKIDNTRINIADDITYYLYYHKGENSTITVIRDGKKVTISGIEFPYKDVDRKELTGNYADQGKTERLYYTDFYVTAEKTTILSALRASFFKSISIVKLVWLSLGQLLSGSVPVTDLSGPVGVTEAIGTAAKSGTNDLFFLIVFISINLGVVNLLPLPALDGGRIVFILIELIIGRPVPPKYEGVVHFAGFALLIAFSIFVTYNDILKLIKA